MVRGGMGSSHFTLPSVVSMLTPELTVRVPQPRSIVAGSGHDAAAVGGEHRTRADSFNCSETGRNIMDVGATLWLPGQTRPQGDHRGRPYRT